MNAWNLSMDVRADDKSGARIVSRTELCNRETVRWTLHGQRGAVRSFLFARGRDSTPALRLEGEIAIISLDVPARDFLSRATTGTERKLPRSRLTVRLCNENSRIRQFQLEEHCSWAVSRWRLKATLSSAIFPSTRRPSTGIRVQGGWYLSFEKWYSLVCIFVPSTGTQALDGLYSSAKYYYSSVGYFVFAYQVPSDQLPSINTRALEYLVLQYQLYLR